MSYYYPQAVMILRVLWEDFGETSVKAFNKEQTITVVPKSWSVEVNDYKEADKFNAEIDYKNFPMDPRLIRAIGVDVFVQDMRSLYAPDGSLNVIQPSEDNVIFQGFADENSIDFDDGTRTVKFEGRDFTSLFIDKNYLEGTFDLSQGNVKSLLEKIVASRVETEKIQVEDRSGIADTINLAKFAEDKGAESGKKNVRRGENYWDVIQDIVQRAGLIAFIEIDKLVIQKPRNLYKGIRTYQFVYGKNLKSLNFKRNLGRQRGFNIKVNSVSPLTKSVISAKVPEEASQEWCDEMRLPRQPVTIKKSVAGQGTAGGTTFVEETAPYISFLVPDVKDQQQLTRIAEKTFEELGRQQLDGSLETKDMAIIQTFEFDSRTQNVKPIAPVEYDITKIRNATAIQVIVGNDELNDVQRISEAGQLYRYLVEKGYTSEVAQTLATLLKKIPLTFYTRNAKFSFDKETGFSMKLDFVNFIELERLGL